MKSFVDLSHYGKGASMPFYTYRDPKTGLTKEYHLPMNHDVPTYEGRKMERVLTMPMINMGRPTHREDEKLAAWDQGKIDYKEY